MAKLPQYQRQVGPGSYRGPTPLQVQQTFEGMDSGESAAAMIGAGLENVSAAALTFAQNLMEVRNKAKAAFDVSQLSKAEKTYWSMMNNAVEIDIPNSGKPITDWDEMYDEADKKAMAAASKLLEDSTQTLMFGGPQQKTVADDLEAFQLNYNTQFRVNLYQKQSKALLDSAAKVMTADLIQLRTNPEYLPVAMQHVDNYVANFPGFSQEAGEKQKENARQVARIATYYRDFEQKAMDWGSVDKAYAWYADPLNTPEMAEEERDRLLQTLSRKVTSIHGIAENNLNERVDKQYIDFVTMFYDPEKGQWLTKDMVTDAFGPLKDANAPNSTEESNDKKEHLYQMIMARDKALQEGKEDPTQRTNEQLYDMIVWSIRSQRRIALGKDGKTWVQTQTPASAEWINDLINDNIGRGLTGANVNSLDVIMNKEMPNGELERSVAWLESMYKSGAMTAAEFGEATSILRRQEREYIERVQQFGAENVKPLDPKWYGQFAQNFIDNVYAKKKDKSKMSQPAADWYAEAKAYKYYPTRGGGGKFRNLESFVELSENGNLAGLARTAEWDQYFKPAEAELGNMVISNILGQNVTNASYVATGRPGVNVFDYVDPTTEKHVRVNVARFSNGKMVFSFPVTEEIAESLPSGKGVKWVYQKDLYVSPTYDPNTDKIGFALYDPASDTFLIDENGNPTLYTFPMAPSKPPSTETGLRRIQEQIEVVRPSEIYVPGDPTQSLKKLEESGRLW